MSDEPMTLERAVEILNDRRHRYADGRSGDRWVIGDPFVYGPDRYDTMYPFEVIAIAEKYEREAVAPPAPNPEPHPCRSESPSARTGSSA